MVCAEYRQPSKVPYPWPPSMLIAPVGALASQNVTRSTGGCLLTRLIPCIMSDAPAPFGSIGSGQSMDSTSKRQQEGGHASRRRTLARSVQRAVGRHVRFIAKPGRALSGNPAVASTPAAAQRFGFPDITHVVVPKF